MANIAVVNSTIAAYNTMTAVTANAADEGTNDIAQIFVFTPTKKGSKLLIVSTIADTHGTVTSSVAAGALWGAGSALSLSQAQNTTKALMLETGKYASATGTISITYTPASGKDLTNDHALSVKAYELL